MRGGKREERKEKKGIFICNLRARWEYQIIKPNFLDLDWLLEISNNILYKAKVL